jgi:hypothetical protein
MIFIFIPPGKIEFRKRSEWTISTNSHSKSYFFPHIFLFFCFFFSGNNAMWEKLSDLVKNRIISQKFVFLSTFFIKPPKMDFFLCL